MVLQCQKYMLKETTFQEVLVPLGEKMNIYATPTKGVLGPLMVFFFFGFKNFNNHSFHCMDQTFPPSGGTKEAVVQRVNHVLFIKELYKVIHTCHKLRGMLVLI